MDDILKQLIFTYIAFFSNSDVIGNFYFPSSIKNLTFGYNFNEHTTSIGYLRNSITHITFGYSFNQDTTSNNGLPNSIIDLTFGYYF